MNLIACFLSFRTLPPAGSKYHGSSGLAGSLSGWDLGLPTQWPFFHQHIDIGKPCWKPLLGFCLMKGHLVSAQKFHLFAGGAACAYPRGLADGYSPLTAFLLTVISCYSRLGVHGKELTCQCRRHVRDADLIPGSGRSPGGGHGNPLQYSCLENPMDREAWWAVVHGVIKSRLWLKQISTHAHTEL